MGSKFSIVSIHVYWSKYKSVLQCIYIHTNLFNDQWQLKKKIFINFVTDGGLAVYQHR